MSFMYEAWGVEYATRLTVPPPVPAVALLEDPQPAATTVNSTAAAAAIGSLTEFKLLSLVY
jgi:hypothetical protein